MPRPLRRLLPDVAAHIVQRGNNRAPCFGDDHDRLIYLAMLRHLAEKHECAVHAYCLMTNHVHLLVTPAQACSCTLLMHDLGQRYVQTFNQRHSRTGTLWEGRFRSFIAESARYVLACYRYIELNPVRAGMVEHPGAYLWSSYAVNAGMRGDALVSPSAEYLALGTEPMSRYAAYRQLLDQPLPYDLLRTLRTSAQSGLALASDAFKAKVMLALGYRTERKKPGPPRAESPGGVYLAVSS